MKTETADRAVDEGATAATRARYDRLARFYDLMERGAERRLSPYRTVLWQRVQGQRVLEVGVGTGKNMAYYPPGLTVTAVDLSSRMLEKARARARREGVTVDLREADAQALPFTSASFDTVAAACLFCSVPDPVPGLSEMRRVLKPGGQLILLEHVLSCRPILRALMSFANPLVVRLMGANVHRETVENVWRAGFRDVRAEDLWLDIAKLIEDRAPGIGAVS
jgi:ubiquinone/menaquinone biosynthesis C-methylase UbiE